MIATTITAAFWRWLEIWTSKYSTDEAFNAAADERRAPEGRIIGTRAGSTADALAKVRLLQPRKKTGEAG
jgi:hypothetical protein